MGEKDGGREEGDMREKEAPESKFGGREGGKGDAY